MKSNKFSCSNMLVLVILPPLWWWGWVERQRQSIRMEVKFIVIIIIIIIIEHGIAALDICTESTEERSNSNLRTVSTSLSCRFCFKSIIVFVPVIILQRILHLGQSNQCNSTRSKKYKSIFRIKERKDHSKIYSWYYYLSQAEASESKWVGFP